MDREAVNRYAHEIETEWKKSVASILSVSDLLSEAYKELEDDDWHELVKTIGFSRSWISKMRKISDRGRFKKISIRNRLPPSYTLIWEYSNLTDREWNSLLDIKTEPIPVSKEATHSSFQKALINWREDNPHPDHKPLLGIRIPKGLFCGFTVPDQIDDEVALEIKHLIDTLESKLFHLGVAIHYADQPTPAKANIVKRRKALAEKLEKEWVKFLHTHNKQHGRTEKVEDIQLLEDTLFQHRYYEEHHKFPYEPNRSQSIENSKHPYFIEKYPYHTIVNNLKKNHQIDKKQDKSYGGIPLSSWTPISDWKEFGQAKAIFWALEHSRSITNKQRQYWKRKLKFYSENDIKHKRIAKKYLDMLVDM
jgi:hypothetical protein